MRTWSRPTPAEGRAPTAGALSGRRSWAQIVAVAVATTSVFSVGASASALAAAAHSPRSGVCAGVAGCRVVARADIDGDGTRDAIGLAREGADGDPEGSVLVRVQVAPSRIVSARTPTEYWYGSVWNGVARLDGRNGSEIVVARTMGAHTALYRALTWREGRLVTLNAPGLNRSWAVDAAYTISMGWLHRPTERDGLVRSRIAERDIETGHWKGTVTAYQWSPDGWNRLSTAKFNHLKGKTAYSWAGFHVPGLKSGL